MDLKVNVFWSKNIQYFCFAKCFILTDNAVFKSLLQLVCSNTCAPYTAQG